MGCENSKCCNRQEVDVGVNCDEPVTPQLFKKNQVDQISFKEYGMNYSPSGKPKEQAYSLMKSVLAQSPESESTKHTRLDFNSVSMLF